MEGQTHQTLILQLWSDPHRQQLGQQPFCSSFFLSRKKSNRKTRSTKRRRRVLTRSWRHFTKTPKRDVTRDSTMAMASFFRGLLQVGRSRCFSTGTKSLSLSLSECGLKNETSGKVLSEMNIHKLSGAFFCNHVSEKWCFDRNPISGHENDSGWRRCRCCCANWHGKDACISSPNNGHGQREGFKESYQSPLSTSSDHSCSD